MRVATAWLCRVAEHLSRKRSQWLVDLVEMIPMSSEQTAALEQLIGSRQVAGKASAARRIGVDDIGSPVQTAERGRPLECVAHEQ